jgi:predicted nucleotidyltransferase
MATYRKTAQLRWQAQQQARTERRSRAWEVAQQATDLLVSQLGATRVQVFGSLAQGEWFSERSDIDLAAWGIADDQYFTAVARLQDLDPQFKVDLLQMERCPEHLEGAIADEGVDLPTSLPDCDLNTQTQLTQTQLNP